MPELTTAQRLAAYRDELNAAGFTPAETAHLVETAAPALIEDVQVQSDIDGTPALTVKVRLESHVDPDSLRLAVDQVEATLQRPDNEQET